MNTAPPDSYEKIILNKQLEIIAGLSEISTRMAPPFFE